MNECVAINNNMLITTVCKLEIEIIILGRRNEIFKRKLCLAGGSMHLNINYIWQGV